MSIDRGAMSPADEQRGTPKHDNGGHEPAGPGLPDDLGHTVIRPRSHPTGEAFIRLADGREVQLSTPILLGRSPMHEDGAQQVEVDDPEFSVSETHLRLDRDAETVWVTDLQSTNGARVILPDGSES